MTDFNGLVDQTPPTALPAQNDNQPEDKFTVLIDQVAQDHVTQAQATTASVADIHPDLAVRAEKVGQQYGLPATAILPQLDQWESRAALDKNNSIVQQDPLLASYMGSNPDKAAQMHDDYEHLSFLGQGADTLSTMLENRLGAFGTDMGWKNLVQYNQLNEQEQASLQGGRMEATEGTVPHPDEELYTFGGKQYRYIPPPAPPTRDIGYAADIGGVLQRELYGPLLRGAGEIAYAPLGYEKFNPLSDLATSIEGAENVTPDEMGQYPITSTVTGQLAGFVPALAGPAAPIAYGIQGAGQESEAAQAYGASPQEVSTARALGFVGGIGTMAAMETLPMLRSVDRASPGFMPWVSAKVQQAAYSGTTFAGLGEAQAWLSAQIQHSYNPQAEYQLDAARTAASLIAGGFLGTIAHSPRSLSSETADFVRYTQSQGQQQAFNVLADGATESKTRARNPDAFQDFINSRLPSDSNVYIPADKVRALYQSAKETPGAGDKVLGNAVPDIAEQLAQADQVGGDVVIPTSDYMAHVAGTEADKALRPDVRLEQDGMSANDIQQYETQMQAQVEKVGKTIEDQPASPEGQIYDDFKSKMLAAGMREREADATARVAVAHYSTWGERYGYNPLDIYQGENFFVRRAGEGENPESDTEALQYAAAQQQAATEKKGIIGSAIQSVKNLITGKNVGEAAPAAVAPEAQAAAPAAPVTRRAVTEGQQVKYPVINKIKQMGGVKVGSNLDSELRSMGITPRTSPGLFRKTGGITDVDNFPHSEWNITVSAPSDATGNYVDRQFVLDQINKEHIEGGKPSFQSNDDHIYAERLGIDVTGKSHVQIWNETKEKQSQEENDKLIASQDEASRVDYEKMMQSEKEFLESRGEAWEPNDNTPATLENLENERRQESAATKTAGRATGIGESGIAGRDQGNGTEGAEFERSGAIVAGRDQPDAGTSSLTQEGNQAVIPGPERITDKELAERKMQEPKRGNTLQKTADDGPFDTDSRNQKSLFQGSEGPPRAKTTWDEGKRIITLFEKADKSSVIHELSHIWLEDLRNFAGRDDAPAALRADWEKAKDFIGHQGDDEISTESHEKWADAFENYMATGRAPSPELRSAFRAFKQWMVKIYKTLKNIGVQPSEDMRGVFDRMLATDDAIEQMKNQQGIGALFRTKDQAGMTDAEFKAYSKAAQNAPERAKEQLLTEALEKIRKKGSADWNKAEKEIRPGIENGLRNRQDIRALDWFKTGKLRDGQGNEVEMPALAIREGSVTPTAAEELPKSVKIKKDGATPDEIAPLLGYDSGAALLNDLAELGRTEKAAGRQSLTKFLADHAVNEQLRDRFNVSDAEMRARAEEMMNERGPMDIKLAELRALQRKAGQQVVFTKENIKAWAETRMNGMQASEAAKTFQYVRAAAKAGREAQRAVLKDDTDGAIQALQRQMLNMALAEKSNGFADDYASGNRLFKYAASRPTIKSTDQGYLDQVHGLLSQLGIKVARDSKELSNALAGKPLRDFVLDKMGIGRDIATADFLFELNTPPLKNLSVEQFGDLRDMVQSLLHNGRDEQSVMVEGKRIEKDRIITEVLNNLASFKEKPKSEYLNPADAGFLRRALDKFTSMVRAADSELLRPEQFLDWLDKRNVVGPLNKYVFRPLKEGQVRENDMLAEISKSFHDLEVPDGWHKSLGDDVQNAKLVHPDTGRAAKLSRKTMLTIALNTGNDSNMKKLTDGYGWKADDMKELLQKNMTKADWDFVQHSWDTFEKMWPEIEALQRRTTGIAPTKIEVTPIKTPHGDYRGGYYPVVYDPNKSQVGGRNLAADSIFDSDYYRPTTSKGHTISRLQNFTDRIHLSLDVMPWKLRQAVHDLAFREAIMNADKILSDKRFQGELQNRWGAEYGKEFRPWLKDIANQPNADNRPISFIDNALRYSRMTMVEMGIGFRITTMAKHGLTALSNSVGEIGPDAMRRGVGEYYSDRDGKRAFVMERSGEMRHRMTQYDRDIRENMRNLMGEDSVLHTMRRFGHYGVAFLDMDSALPTWIGAYRKGLADGMEDKDAVYYADKTVRNAHGAQGQVDLAGVQRGPEYKKLFTMFYGFFNHMYNRERDITRLAQESANGRDMAKILGKTLAYIAVPALVEQAISGQSDKDEGWGKWAAKAVMNQMASTIPLVRDVSGYLEHGRAQETPMSRTIRALGDQAKDIGNAVGGNQVSQKWLKHAIETPGYITGAPTGQIATSAQYLWDVSDGKENPKDVKDWLHGLMYGTSKPKK